MSVLAEALFILACLIWSPTSSLLSIAASADCFRSVRSCSLLLNSVRAWVFSSSFLSAALCAALRFLTLSKTAVSASLNSCLLAFWRSVSGSAPSRSGDSSDRSVTGNSLAGSCAPLALPDRLPEEFTESIVAGSCSIRPVMKARVFGLTFCFIMVPPSADVAVIMVPATPVFFIVTPDGRITSSAPNNSTHSVLPSTTMPAAIPPRTAIVAEGVLNTTGVFFEILPPTRRNTPLLILIVISPRPVAGS